MSYPDNPDTVVIKNRIVPQGIKEIDVWDHYQKAKSVILRETRNRDVMFAIMTQMNKPVMRRKGVGGQVIRLTPTNYDQIITGRTVAIHSTMGLYEDFGIIDIDVAKNVNFRRAKEATADVYDYVMDKMPLVTSAQIRFTGKQSFHIKCDFNRKTKIDTIRSLLRRFLTTSDLARNYTIEPKRTGSVANLDLSPNKYKGNYITLNSLSVWGLPCVEVPFQSLMRFEPRQARI